MALEIDHSAVSRHLKALQDWLGIELVAKADSARHLTDAGEQYYKEVFGSLKRLIDATQSLKNADRGRLSIHCSPGFAVRWLTRHVAKFQALAHDIEIDLRPTDTLADFSRENVNADIRYLKSPATLPGMGLRSLEFARPAVYAVASPLYLKRQGAFRSIAAMKGADLLHEDGADDWADWFSALGCPGPEKLPGDRLWHAHVTIEAAIHGRGLALANDLLVREDLAAGSLVRVVVGDAREVPEAMLGSYHFITTKARWPSPILRTFRQWLQKEVRAISLSS